MNKQEKNEVIEVLKGKFSQYNNFYLTNTEALTTLVLKVHLTPLMVLLP
jgi:hypothetical protein